MCLELFVCLSELSILSVDDVCDTIGTSTIQLESKIGIMARLQVHLVNARAGWGCWHPGAIKLHVHGKT